MTGSVSIGVAGSLGPGAIARLAPVVEQAGFRSLWVNDTPGGDALDALAAAASVTERLVLATGVVPVDRRAADDIAEQVERAALPQDRLVLGIGSGAQRKGSLGRVESALRVLRERLSARLFVGALGPRMRQLAAEASDGVLLNWVPADAARHQVDELRTQNPRVGAAVYVRTAIDPRAHDRLTREAERYASFANYAANFERLGVAAIETTFPDAAALEGGIPGYRRAVDEVVLRAVTVSDTVEEYVYFAERAAEMVALNGSGHQKGGGSRSL